MKNCKKSIEGTLQKIEEVKTNVQNSSSKIEELKQERTLKMRNLQNKKMK